MFALMSSRRFAPLFWTQFLSAFNDNFLKNAIVFFILFKLAGADSQALVTLAGAVFIAPSFLFSGLGGELADRFDKAKVARTLKAAEIAAAGVGAAGFLIGSLPMLFGALFLFGIVSALFGPIKYGILPDHLSFNEIPAGNALVEGATFIAILLGAIAGGVAVHGGHTALFSALMVALAVACWLVSRAIPATAEAAPALKIDRNPFRSSLGLLKDLWADTRLWRAGVIVSLFWLIGALILSLAPSLIKVMGGNETVVTLHLAEFSIAIAIGSALGSFLSTGRVVLLPAPVACFVIGAVALDVGFVVRVFETPAHTLDATAFFSTPSAWRLAVDFALMAIMGGVFVVPAFSAVQVWAPNAMRARIVGAVNILSSAFIFAGALAVSGLQGAGLSVGGVFFLIGGLSLLGSVWIFLAMPTSALRDFFWLVFRAAFRVEASGLENFAKAGPNAIVALNHVSFLDAALALSVLDRDPLFAIDHGIAQRWWVKPFLRLVRAMPLDPAKPLAVRTLVKAVRDRGETLVIFPEGRLTVTGSLMKVYDGAGLIAEKSGAAIVPVRLDGVEATPFTRLKPDQVRRRWFPKVRIIVREPVRLTVDDALTGRARREAAGQALYDIMSDLIFHTTTLNRTVFEAVVEAAQVHGKSRIALEDPVTGQLTYKRALIGARILGAKLTGLAGEGEAVGVMLPTSNGAMLTALGLMSANRVPAMINFTSGAANIASACRAAQISTIVTSRAFIEKAKLGKLIEALQGQISLVYLEDVRGGVTWRDKISAALRYQKPLAKAKASGRAVILFTSGSEGAPKGVVLSPANLLANVAQAAARIDFGRRDKVFNVLPIFHSFGLTIGAVLPLVSGVPVFLYPSPLHYRFVPELIYGSNATVLFGTDTFLTGYARMAHPYDFRSIRYILAGAEPVRAATRALYMENFGLRILEGYGVTETAPVLALNTPMYNRSGTVGRILPGIETRLDHVEGVDEGGRLLVRGPNVMLGYLKADKPGLLEPANDGWHDTGDIVSVDRSGFVTIKGRAKRFAKIGGEMVSLAAVEEMASQCWPGVLSAAAALPDERKGQRLVLLTQEKGASRAALQQFAKAKGAADLMIPAEVLVEPALPLLGSGKLDFAGVRKLVEARCAAPCS
jgi:acyl-[acyl-carrier-protein]-phospholipid O-acyltransferase / long-chain-fatty-acid--[acyl-carrier-protein] ligase